MVSETESEKTVGNTYFYLDIYKFRQPTFLQRNLRSALKYHEERLLKRPKTAKTSHINVQSSVENSIVDQRAWTFPSRDTLDVLVKAQNPILKIDIKGIKRKALDGKGLSALTPSVGNRAWLFTTSCLIELRIYPFGDSVARTCDAVWFDKKWGEIECFRDAKNETAFNVKFAEPYLVKLNNIVTLITKGEHWKKTFAARYELVLTISFKEPKDAYDVISLFYNPSDGLAARVRALYGPYLRVSYPELPNCPHPDALLDLFVYYEATEPPFRNQLTHLAHGIQLSMGWTQAVDTPFKLYNRVHRTTQIPARANAGQPASNPQKESQKSTRAGVVYVFPDSTNASRRVTLEGFACALCNKRDFLSAEFLRFHLDRSHSRFDFDIDIKSVEAGNSATSNNGLNVAMHIHVKLANGSSDDSEADTKNRQPIWWQAPREPFNIAKFLSGDRSWIADLHPPAPRKEQRPKNGVMRPIQHHFAMPAIKQINRGIRKKYRVPRAPPNITFFRTISKRPLTEGELLSESDNEVDKTWLKMKHQASIDSMTHLSAQEKAFIKLWDSHFEDEDLPGDRFVPNALLRFVHANRTALREQSMGLEFLKKAAQLRMDGVISGATIVTCLHIIQAAEPEAPISNRNQQPQQQQQATQPSPDRQMQQKQ